MSEELDRNALAAALAKLDLIQLQHASDGGWVECREFGPVRLDRAEHHALWLARHGEETQ